MYGRLPSPGEQGIYTHYNHLSPSCQMGRDPPLPFGRGWAYNKVDQTGKFPPFSGAKTEKRRGKWTVTPC